MDKAQTAALKLALLEVLINAVFYNPAPALQLMEQHRPGTASAFIKRWFDYINHEPKDKLPRVHDKKLTLCGLSALMELEPSQLPSGLDRIVSHTLRVFKALPGAIAGTYVLCSWRLSAYTASQLERHNKRHSTRFRTPRRVIMT